MRRLGPLLISLVSPLASPVALAQAQAAARPQPPYVCSTLHRWNNVEWGALVTSEVPASGPILVPLYWFETDLSGAEVLPTRPALEEALQGVTVTVRDAEGASVAGEPGGEVDAEGRTTHRLWSWHPEAQLAPGVYSVELASPETIVWGNCNVLFTPFDISVTVSTTSTTDWADAAELTLTDSWEARHSAPSVDCCTVVAAECATVGDCVQCWDYTTSPVFGAEWTGEGFLWLDMAIEPSAGELTVLGKGSGDPATAQYALLDWGEVCVEGRIGPRGEAATRVIERCTTITSSRPAGMDGRTRVGVESCATAPNVPEGTRGLLVVRADTEAEARSVVEPMAEEADPNATTDAVAAGDVANVDDDLTLDSGGSVEGAVDLSASEPAPQSSAADANADSDVGAQLESDEPSAPQEPDSPQPAPAGSLDASGCAMAHASQPTWHGWLFALAAALALRRRVWSQPGRSIPRP